jgi:predicted nucleic acid-binding protein
VPATLVDSNVLLDLFDENSLWFSWSKTALEEAADAGRLLINPIIYAEISVGYDQIEKVDALLPAVLYREPIAYEAAFLAAKAYQIYRRRGGQRLSPLPDFFIGAHAAVGRHDLITRDPRHYRTYFPTVRIIAP